MTTSQDPPKEPAITQFSRVKAIQQMMLRKVKAIVETLYSMPGTNNVEKNAYLNVKSKLDYLMAKYTPGSEPLPVCLSCLIPYDVEKIATGHEIYDTYFDLKESWVFNPNEVNNSDAKPIKIGEIERRLFLQPNYQNQVMLICKEGAACVVVN